MNIMFVNLGKRIPPYLYENIKLTQELFPNCKILFITDHHRPSDELELLNVRVLDYIRDERVSELLEKMPHDKEFRSGFWQLTTDRLFAICQSIIRFNLKDTLYLESDVRLFSDFPINRIVETGKIRWARYNEVRDVASVVYVPNPADAQFLEEELLREFSEESHHTDMTALNNIARLNLDRIKLFPTVVPGLENKNYLQKDIEKSQQILHEVSSDDFDGIFDGAILGMWLSGQDPRNNYGFTKYLNPILLSKGESYVNPSLGKFEVKPGYLGIVVNSKYVPIYNLHIHSKNVSLFTFDTTSKFLSMVNLANTGAPYKTFSFTVLRRLLLESVFKGRTLRFIYGFLTYFLR